MANQTLIRGAGILCHVSSLWGEYGIGSLGKEAYKFADFLYKSGVKYWQILPTVQTGYGDSPYQSVCASSGNPYFIDLEDLFARGLLTKDELDSAKCSCDKVDYCALYENRYALLKRAYSRFNLDDDDFKAFVQSGEYDDYALFMSLKERYGCSFAELPTAYKFRESLALDEFRQSVYESDYCFWLFLQYTFKNQWQKLKKYINNLGIKLIGDLPLYVAYDSADVWANPTLFKLDEDLKPTLVAGVPPDYFSATGQLWGNPVYDWQAIKDSDFEWWTNRIKKAQETYDVIRIDHFRGLDRYFAIEYGKETAEQGEWLDGPKEELFAKIYEKVGDVCIIAEDLGVLDDGVIALRDNLDLPGMNILLFAFDGDENNAYLPNNVVQNSVTYTGTHDNATALGFLNGLDKTQFKQFKSRLRKVLASQGVYYPMTDRKDVVQALIICALNTISNVAIVPVQDVLALDDDCRMNTPSTDKNNWQFRLKQMPTRQTKAILKQLIKNSNR